MHYFLALDAGGTKTECVLADETRELARVRTGTIKRMRVGADIARANLESAFQQLSAATGVSLQSITATCVGTSGSSVPLVTDWIRETITSLVSGELIISGDEDIALDAAFRGGRGVLVIAGTGSNVGGRTRDGRFTHVGGWGPMLADEGSGYWIGHQALRSLFQAINARKPTLLQERILQHWNLTDFHELVAVANAVPAPDFPALTPTVVACAKEGDPFALEVLERGGRLLAGLALNMIEHLREMEGPEGFELPEVAFIGSVLHNVDYVRNAMIDALHQVHPSLHVIPEAVDGVEGALWQARHLVLPVGTSL
ncbi:N-acetylglucosamine kinase [Granulicella arctica]|uniref:N-acetylglucosamine kinase-like BadF-type ATPase n=1 Tax=Granulicella arctica TaxID=940613 RepID=A0A7Y9THJ1_9BACT|nr:BadF/BadG/BcrA/BcrD ATPase family protein [Granulicella arctica]NYF81131.1 N-acetylglucosamine kinase-like BadF-type ATPase [Granulicella arctica]